VGRFLPGLLAAVVLAACDRAPPERPNPLRTVATAELIERLREKPEPRDVFEELVRRGAPVLPELLAALRTADDLPLDCDLHAHRVAAVIGRIGADAVPALRQLLRSGPSRERARALLALALVGKPARGASGDVIAALADVSSEVRKQAACALPDFGPCDDAGASALTAALRGDPDAFVRGWAAMALGRCAHGRAGVEEALVEALRADEDEVVREVAAGALADLPAVSGATLAALKAASETDATRRVREAAYYSHGLARQKFAER
jgi:HEAT repeat protein